MNCYFCDGTKKLWDCVTKKFVRCTNCKHGKSDEIQVVDETPLFNL